MERLSKVGEINKQELENCVYSRATLSSLSLVLPNDAYAEWITEMTRAGLDYKNPVGEAAYRVFKNLCIIERKTDGTLEWTQPTLIHSILKDLRLEAEGLKNQPKIRTIPASSTVALTDHQDSPDHNSNEFDYRQVIGKLLYLEKSTRPDISCAVHQFARFSANPKNKHAEAAKRIGRYLLGTQEKDLVMKPNQNGLECWVDIMCIRMGQQDSSK